MVELYIAGLVANKNTTSSKTHCRKQLIEYRKTWANLSTPDSAVEELDFDILFPLTLQDIPPVAVVVHDIICAWKGNSVYFRRIGSAIRGIPDEIWTLKDLQFNIESVTMNPSEDLLAVIESAP